MTFLFKLEALLDRLVSAIGKAGCWLFVAMMLLITLDVIGRRFMSLPTIKFQELEWYLHTVLFMLTIGFAYLANAHVRIDIVSGRLSARTQDWIELVGCLVFMLPYMALCVWLGIRLTVLSYAAGEHSMSPEGLPHVFLIKAVLPLGFLVIVVSGIAVVLRTILRLATRRGETPVPPPVGTE